ncbi:MAG TPA: ComF family protein [Dehalococcoidia bacterium]|nr:ComF family protein [Dehalococcoidia bacterium]
MNATTPRHSLLSSVWNGVLDIVFPPQCVSCRKWGSFICEACEQEMQPANGERCGVCWQPSLSFCEACSEGAPTFEAARSAYAFEGPARDLVHALKYRGVAAVAPIMADAMTGRLADWEIDVDGIVAVPMAGTRQRRRGYNQAEMLAREISRATAIPLVEGIIRRRAGESQVDQPGKQARWRNAARAYEARRKRSPRSVLLVDDAMTTGATLDACARVLRAVGAQRIYGLTFARES